MKIPTPNKRSLAMALSTVLMLSIAVYLFVGDPMPYTQTAAFGSRGEVTLIIDAGHGGEDGGAVSPSGIYESEINLSIALKLEQVAGLLGMPVVMTRSTAEIDYPADAQTIREKKVADQYARLKLIKETENGVLISIHQNNFINASPFGAQVLFAETETSREFADMLQNMLINALNPKNYRTASEISDDVFLLSHVDCPAILVECGFLSNGMEETLLQTDEYQLKIAITIAAAYSDSMDKFTTYYGGTYEG